MLPGTLYSSTPPPADPQIPSLAGIALRTAFLFLSALAAERGRLLSASGIADKGARGPAKKRRESPRRGLVAAGTLWRAAAPQTAGPGGSLAAPAWRRARSRCPGATGRAGCTADRPPPPYRQTGPDHARSPGPRGAAQAPSPPQQKRRPWPAPSAPGSAQGVDSAAQAGGDASACRDPCSAGRAARASSTRAMVAGARRPPSWRSTARKARASATRP